MKILVVFFSAILITGCAHHNRGLMGPGDYKLSKSQSGSSMRSGDESSARASLTNNMPSEKEMIEFGKPNDSHKKLDPLIGTWRHTVRWWMSPDSKPQVMTGTNVNTWILGKRFVREEVKGGDPKRPFAGLGLIGFDKVRGEYNSIWIDNMATGMMAGTGHINKSASAITETGTFSCPLTPEERKSFRAVLGIDDDTHYSYEMFTTAPDGREFKTLDIVYERIGAKPKGKA